MRFTFTADCLAALARKASASGLTVALTLAGYGCNADRIPPPPLSPGPAAQVQAPAPPAPPAPPGPRVPGGELWKLTTTIVSLEGAVCFWHWSVGKTFDFGHFRSSAMAP